MIRRYAALVATAVLLAGCASSGASAASQSGAARPHRSPDVITEEELENANETDLYTAIQKLRPNFLVTRGPTTIVGTQIGVVVYMDNNRLGGVSALRQISVNDVKRVEHLSASEATQRYGTGTPNGVILVTRK